MNQRVYIIAEIGNTHEGSLGLAKKFIEAAAECGVDAVKFQTHIFEAESLPTAPTPNYFQEESRRDYFERTSFREDQWREIALYANKMKVDFLSSPFSLEAVDVLEKIKVQIYKIPSGEVSDVPLLKKIAQTHKKVFLSSGMSSWKELDTAVETLKREGNQDITVMQCTSTYPCAPKESGLNLIGEIKKRYGYPVGLSDHTMGEAIPLAAVALGIEVLEKHFTLSKKMYGSDAPFSMEPFEFKKMVAGVREIESALSHPVDKDAKAESLARMKLVFEKSVVSAQVVSAGEVLEDHHLAYKKPGDGIPASAYMRILGRKAARDIPKDEKLKWEDLN